MKMFLRIGVVLSGSVMAIAAMPAPVLTGVWGGGRATLTLTGDGGTLIEDCQTATLTGPVRLHGGRFVAVARREVHRAGPQIADVAPTYLVLSIAGHVAADRLHLEIAMPGAPTERHELIAGRRVKAIRCY